MYVCKAWRTSRKSSSMSWELLSSSCRKVMMWDDLSGDSCLGGVLGNRHGPTKICAVVRSIFGGRGGGTITAGRIGSS